MAAEGFAPAKVNLTLHITGQRADGYHLLDSLVVFADVGDRISAEAAPDLALRVTGPRAAGVPVDGSNLVLRAARLLAPDLGADLVLDKVLPVASGIGGGSADAAATLRVLAGIWRRPLPDRAALVTLGADVPVCLAGVPARMQGVGEGLSPVPALPPVWLVLANPGVAVSTPAVFRALERRDTPGMPDALPDFGSAGELAGWLRGMRNDLEAPALRLAPEIARVLAALAARPGCLIARMSGSGATCFGMFADPVLAQAAASAIGSEHAGWWVAAAAVLGG